MKIFDNDLIDVDSEAQSETWQEMAIVTNDTNVTSALAYEKPDMSIISSSRLPAPAFPLKLLHPRWQAWVLNYAEAKNCPIDYVAHGLLICSAGLIGNNRRIQPWDGWEEPMILWGGLVGNPSSGKSPALDGFFKTISVLENERMTEYKEKLAKYLEQSEIARAHQTAWKNLVKEAVAANSKEPIMPDKAKTPIKPVQPRYVITDSTVEKIAILLVQFPKGLTMYRDELSSWLLNFERRGGSDRAFYLESFGGRSYIVDRVKHDEPIIVPSLSLSIIGGIQPDRFNSILLNGDDDGLTARFLFVWPDSFPSFKQPLNPLDNTTLTISFRRLINLYQIKNESGEPVSKTIQFTEEARLYFTAWGESLAAQEQDLTGPLLSHFGKYRGIAVRIAGVLAYLEYSLDGQEEPDCINVRHIVSAIGLIEGYYFPMARRCFTDASIPTQHRDALVLAQWIMQHRPSIINVRGFARMKGSPIRDYKRAKEAIAELVEARWLIPTGERHGDRGGRIRQDYLINPRVHEEQEHV